MHGSCDMYVASDAPDPAGACMPCLCLEVCAALLSCWRSLSSGPGYLIHFSPTGTHSPVEHLASLSSGVPAVFISGALAPIYSPSWALSSQLISKIKKSDWVPAILHSCWRSLSRWCLASLSSRSAVLSSLLSASHQGY